MNNRKSPGDILKSDFESRQKLDPRLSLRAYAFLIGVSAGFLPLLFKGKKNLSIDRAHSISKRLKLDPATTEILLQAVYYQRMQVAAQKLGVSSRRIQGEDFASVADWYHFSIVEYLKFNSGPPNFARIAKTFRISEIEAKSAVARLVGVGLLDQKESGRLEPIEKYYVPSFSSRAIRKLHRQYLEKSIEALDGQPVERRQFRGLTMAVDANRQEEVAQFFTQFLEKFEKKFSQGKRNAVYHLGIVYFQTDLAD